MISLELEDELFRAVDDYNTQAVYSTGPWKQPPQCIPIDRFS